MKKKQSGVVKRRKFIRLCSTDRFGSEEEAVLHSQEEAARTGSTVEDGSNTELITMRSGKTAWRVELTTVEKGGAK